MRCCWGGPRKAWLTGASAAGELILDAVDPRVGKFIVLIIGVRDAVHHWATMKNENVTDPLEARAQRAEAKAQEFRERIEARQRALAAAIGDLLIRNLRDPEIQAVAAFLSSKLNPKQAELLNRMLSSKKDEA